MQSRGQAQVQEGMFSEVRWSVGGLMSRWDVLVEAESYEGACPSVMTGAASFPDYRLTASVNVAAQLLAAPLQCIRVKYHSQLISHSPRAER